ncbi:hypothetical protein LZ32DRAFT_392334 [Colletotrichum eremochloae]|nr:hypothetical protein LZ32DRAFT_392334 [Colletotrichum eremochloae]
MLSRFPTSDWAATTSWTPYTGMGPWASTHAAQDLSYRPYRRLEVFRNGVLHMRIMNDAVVAGSRGGGAGPSCGADFDKWLGGYDAITDIPSWMLRHPVATCLDAWFVLIERYPEA